MDLLDVTSNYPLSTKVVNKAFVYDALFDNLNQELIECYSAAFIHSVFPLAVMVIQIDNYQENTGNTMHVLRRQQVVDLISNCSDKTVLENFWIAALGNKEAVLLMNVNNNLPFSTEEMYVRNRCERLKAYLKPKIDFTFSIGIGCSRRQFAEITESYQEACTALKYKFYKGNDVAIHFSEIKKGERESQQIFLSYETRILENIRNGWWNFIAELIENLFLELNAEEQVDPDVLKVRILEMLTVISRTAIDLGVDPHSLLDIKVNAGNEIGDITTLAEMRIWLTGIVNKICIMLQGKQKATTAKAITKAKQYISENFSNEITLEQVAKSVYLSPCYFSHAFTELVGLSFTDYLKSVRLKYAQRLLLITDKSVAEIAAEVGYKDANYFGRVFKQMIGQSPGRYRKGNA